MLNLRTVSTTETSLKTFFQNTVSGEKWRPGRQDVECLLSFDPTGLYVGELDGKPIAVMTLLKYEDGYCFLGNYVVREEYRKQGFGSYMIDAVLKQSSPTNLALHSFLEMEAKYKERSGVIKQWNVYRYDHCISEAFEALKNVVPPCKVEIKRPMEVDLRALYKYDAAVFGYNRQVFIKCWLQAKGSHARVAIDDGCVVGYLVVRPAFVKEEGYRVGPLYCDSVEVAKCLIKETFKEIVEENPSSSLSVLIDWPETNEEAKQLIKLLHGKFSAHSVFMCSNGVPRGCFRKWFAITALEYG